MEKPGKTEIIDFLRKNREFLKSKYGVKSIGLIGSYARDEQTEESDIDFLVEFTEISFSFHAGLLNFLENTFGRKVDIIRDRESLRKVLSERLHKEVLYA
jgi:predicted nucleotidyltransferase